MSKTDKKTSFDHYFFYISLIIMLLCGLMFLLSSCDERITGDSSSGKMVKVHFSLGQNSGGSEVVSRSYKVGAKEPETVVIPLEGNLFMYATLKEDHVVGTRSFENLVEGSQIRVVAYKDNSTTTILKSEHTVQADGSLNPGIMEVEENEVYTFVAYGYKFAWWLIKTIQPQPF